ncbi:hypothetical protein [Daejeonella sp.]|uniref:hypothetical protein n=1 Tax=Daejeonella sp. TaxID=2805397 RepID=UPI0030BD76A0
MRSRHLDNSEFIALIVSFDEATAYQDKLVLWERHFDFQVMETHRVVSLKYLKDQSLRNLGKTIFVNKSMYTANISLSIKPQNAGELLSYNQWAIGQWRKYYTAQERKRTYNKFLPPLRTYDTLKATLLPKLAHLSKPEQASLLTELHDRLFGEIIRMPNKELLLKVLQLFLTEDEDEIFGAIDTNQTSALRELRVIGKLWEQLKFMAFIDTARKKLKVSQFGSPFEIAALSTEQMQILFSEMIDNNFIASDTSPMSFFSMLKQEPVKSKIRWIDMAPTNQFVNKGTLITFIHTLETNKTGNNAQLYKFIIAYFEIEIGVEIINLKQANQESLNTNRAVNERYIILDEIIKKAMTRTDTLTPM